MRSYPKVVNLLLKNVAADQAIAIFDVFVLRCMQPVDMTMQLYTIDLTTKSCKLDDVFVEEKLNDAFIEGVGSSFSPSLKVSMGSKPPSNPDEHRVSSGIAVVCLERCCLHVNK